MSAGIVVAEDIATVLLDDAVTDAQTESSSFPDFLRGEEREEDLLGMRDAISVVGERNFHEISGLGGQDLDARRTADIVDRVIRVVQDIKEDLL